MARGKGYTLLLTPTETILVESKTQVSTRSNAFVLSKVRSSQRRLLAEV